jgi:hypothetical protein
MEVIIERNGDKLKTDFELLKDDLNQQVKALEFCAGGEDDEMLFYTSYFRLYIKARECDIKKYNMLKNAPKDKHLNPNTIKAARICNSVIKVCCNEMLELMNNAAAAGQITEYMYIDKANALKDMIEKHELEDRVFYN